MITRPEDISPQPIDRPDMVSPDPVVANLEPMAVGGRTMCLLLGVSETTLGVLVREQAFPVIRLPGKNLYPVAAAREWLAARVANGATEATEATQSQAKTQQK